MNTLSNQKKFAMHVCRLLKVTYLNLPVGRTDKGNFSIIFNENGDWDMMLDSVPLSTKNVLTDENNIELKRMVQKYLFELDYSEEKFSLQETPIVVDTLRDNMYLVDKEIANKAIELGVGVDVTPKNKKAPAKHGRQTNKKAA